MEKYFKILGINPGASQAEIKNAFRKSIFRAHPDRQPEHKKAQAGEQARQIFEAYEALREIDSPHAQKPLEQGTDWSPEDQQWAEDCYSIWTKNRSGSALDAFIEKSIRGSRAGHQMACLLIDRMYAEKHPGNRYWLGFNRGNGYEIRGFPSLSSMDNFRRETFYISQGRVYDIDESSLRLLGRRLGIEKEELQQTLETLAKDPEKKMRSSGTQLSLTRNILDLDHLEQIAHMIYNDEEHHPKNTAQTRLRSQLLHKILKQGTRNVRAFNSNVLQTEINKYLSTGFEWYRSEWGETFLSMGNQSIYTLQDIEAHQKGVIFDVNNTTPYLINNNDPNFNPSMFNLFYGETVVGKIYIGDKVAGIYIERNPLDIFTQYIGQWTYQEFGKTKEVLLKPGIIDPKQIAAAAQNLQLAQQQERKRLSEY